MYPGLKGTLLRALKVPPEPDPPAGHEGTLRTFRAAPSYFRYKLALWAIAQFFSLIVLFFLVVGFLATSTERADGLAGCFLTVILGGGILLVLFQLLVSFLGVRLDYEMRWYLVTDQSLRIREGIFHVREMTMTFANIQNISISQGPLQRLLGVADLEVKSAGGGGGGGPGKNPQQAGTFSMHTGYFRGVDNAEELRDLMRERMRKAKGAGLGDPDDEQHPREPRHDWVDSDLASVLTEVVTEARALRGAAEALG
ncbi:MAG: PH domain-containing protein [Thermoanaerobaculia bacterium]|nr:PH domain-containing protein [Thermoanaerobaculia bacterium]